MEQGVAKKQVSLCSRYVRRNKRFGGMGLERCSVVKIVYCSGRVLAPTSGGSELPETIAIVEPISSSSLFTHCIYKRAHTHIHTSKF